MPDEIQIDEQFQNPTSTIKKSVPLLAPLANEVRRTKQKSDELTTEDFAPPPYSKISLDEINFGDIITTNPHSKSAYEVKAHNGNHVLAVCLYNQALPKRVGKEFYFKVPYLIERATEEVIVAAHSSDELCKAA